MLSYQHAFHAGNHADILKHFVLYLTIESLNKKDKPYTFFDTHSGSGLYDLFDNRSLKTGEAEKGIQKIMSSSSNFTQDFNNFKNFISQFTSKNLYPGSPLIEQSLMRNQDNMIISELHPQEILNLRNNLKSFQKPNDCSVQIHNRNGWEMLTALTPPKTKRGAVLIDPSYEETEDYENAAKTICSVNKKWSNGIILLWYPLLAHREVEINRMCQQIEQNARNTNPNVEISNFQLCVQEKNAHKEVSLEENAQIKNPPRLYGSGMLVINTPYQLKEKVLETIPILHDILKI